MALITCPECGKQISEDADSCAVCGRQISQDEAAEIKSKENAEKPAFGMGCLVILAPILILIFYHAYLDLSESYRNKQREFQSYCYKIGVEYGKCEAQMSIGMPCDSENDIKIPEKCRDLEHTERGIKAGHERVQRQQEKIRKEQEIQEAIKRGEFPRAFRNINFGDSNEEVNRKIIEDNLIGNDKTVTLAGVVYCQVDFDFWENQLYSVAFIPNRLFPYENSTDPRLIKQRDFFVSLITEQYGPPSTESGPTWSRRYTWTPEDLGEQKRIRILTVNFSGSQWTKGGFFPLMEIYFPPFFDAYHKAKETSEKEKARRKKEAQRVRKKEAAEDF